MTQFTLCLSSQVSPAATLRTHRTSKLGRDRAGQDALDPTTQVIHGLLFARSLGYQNQFCLRECAPRDFTDRLRRRWR